MTSQLRAFTWCTLLSSALACGADKPTGPVSPAAGGDSLPVDTAPPDPQQPPSIPGPDSVSPPVDSTPPTDSLLPPIPSPNPSPAETLPTPPVRTFTGIPFGMFRLWRDSTNLAWGPGPFSMTFNSINANGIIGHINAARRAGVQLVLAMSTGSRYVTDGKFDMAKWKAKINTFDRPDIKAAVQAGMADGTIIGNAVLDEPNTKKWGGVVDKAMVDEMCAYVRKVFPGLPQGVPVVHWWRPTEKYKICDFIIDQWSWWQGPNGAGEGAYSGNLAAWRDAALAQAKHDGVALAFSLNVIDGGIQSWATKQCPSSTTGGYGTRPPRCRMTPKQIKEWGLTLGPLGCAMFIWWYRDDFMSVPENVRALEAIGQQLSSGPRRTCKRPT